LGPSDTGHPPIAVPFQSGQSQLLKQSILILLLIKFLFQLADMVNLHFVNTLQALQQVNSAVLCQLYPMWEPVLTAHHAHVPRQLRLKLDAVEAQVCFWTKFVILR
jgi:hypothetical protein